MIRSGLKTAVSAVLAWSGGAAVFGRVTGVRRAPLVIGYHRVVGDFERARREAIAPSLVSVRTLLRHLEWIGRRYDICSLDEVHEALPGLRGRPRAAVTFDDAYADVFYNAFPVLSRKGIPFAVFAATDLVGTEELFVHDELYLRMQALVKDFGSRRLTALLKDTGCHAALIRADQSIPETPYSLTRAMLEGMPRTSLVAMIHMLREMTQISEMAVEGSRVMDWDMLRAMRRSGVVIGCHSRRHALLTNEKPEVVREETEGGREILERELGCRVKHFAYPDGAYDRPAIAAVARAGYRYAYTVCQRPDPAAPQLTIPRRMMWEHHNSNVFGRFSGGIMTCRVNGVFDFRRLRSFAK